MSFNKHGWLDSATPVNWFHPLNRGLVAEWAVVQPGYGGTAFRNLVTRGLVKNGANNANITWLRRNLVFNGTNTRVSLDDSSALIASGDFSIVSIYTPTDAVSGGMIYRMGDNPSDNDANLQQGNLFNGGTASRISLIHYSAGWQVCTGATDLVNGRRYWAAGTFSGTNGSVVYLNGVADGTDGNTTRGGVPSTHAAIGANAVTDQYYLNGSIESVLLYNRALTAGECLSLYKEMMQDNPFRWNWINNSLVRNVGAALKSRGLLSGGNLLGQGMLSGGRL